MAYPTNLADTLVNVTFPAGRERNRAPGAGAAGLVVGVLLGGVLTRAFGWPAVFLVNFPLAAAALLLAFPLLDATPWAWAGARATGGLVRL